MTTLKIIKKWFCAPFMPLFFTTQSQSQANQTTKTDTYDNRIAAAQDSINLNNANGSINGDVLVQKLDGGAVSSSFDFAKQIASGAAAMMAASVDSTASATTSALQAVKQAYATENANLSDAYKTAKAGEQKIMVYGALLIGGLVAIKALKRGG
jgi:hypothetical protein